MDKKVKLADHFYDDFEVGDIYKHPNGRTIIDTDNIWFSNITLNTNQIHFNEDYAAKTAFQRPLVNSCFTFMLVTGICSDEFSQNSTVLKWTNVKMPKPLFVGETVYAESKVVNKYEDGENEAGIIEAKTRGITETGKVIMEYSSVIKVCKAGFTLRKEMLVKSSK